MREITSFKLDFAKSFNSLLNWTQQNLFHAFSDLSKCCKDIDECASYPCVHGNCTDQENAFICECSDGWTGVTCDEGQILAWSWSWSFFPVQWTKTNNIQFGELSNSFSYRSQGRIQDCQLGGRKRLCSSTHIMSAEPNSLSAGVQGPLKGPGSLMLSRAIWALYLSILIKCLD